VPNAQKIAVKDIQLGFDHSCLLTTTGDVKCWGSNEYGQLGDGTTTNQNKPVTTVSDFIIRSLTVGKRRYFLGLLTGIRAKVHAIAVGNYHSCAITTRGLFCWGSNEHGQLGDGTTTNQNEPVPVSGLNGDGHLSDVRAIVLGENYSCALTTTGGVNCWGWNNRQLGIMNNITDQVHPVAISDLSGVRALRAGSSHSCALTMTNNVMCLGSNLSGQLGDGTITSRYKSKEVLALSDVRAIALGHLHSCALTITGDVECWGSHKYGQLGDGTTTGEGKQKNKPVKVDLSDVHAIALGYHHSCALMTTGGVKCWGQNDTGQLGDSTTKQQNKPVKVFGLSGGVSAITVGAHHSCALMTTGGVKCWGYNYHGQLGDGSSKNERYKPVDVQLDSD